MPAISGTQPRAYELWTSLMTFPRGNMADCKPSAPKLLCIEHFSEIDGFMLSPSVRMRS